MRQHETLIAGLHALGVRFIGPTPEGDGPSKAADPPELITGLATSDHPRLRSALIALFLRHPDLSEAARTLAGKLDEPAATSLKIHYTAAVYLQRRWRTRLGLYLGPFDLLPDHFSTELGLPPPEERHGKLGLHRLAALQAERTGSVFDYLGSYEKVLELLIGQLRAEGRLLELPTLG